jgi:tRNA/tmRNA/rRNA uracil-C5-methylase (TrmA/RlmC/RlmD family)
VTGPAPGSVPTPGAGQVPGHVLAGAVLELEVGAVAHGGHCVARHQGQVVFVRHALPGERVRARVTEGAAGARFLRADAVEVLLASPDRVEPACEHARPGGCGGCDFQHASLAAQRELKAAVVREQMVRLARLDPAQVAGLVVEHVDGDTDGLGWRTRVRFAVDAEGRAGLRRHRSHDVVALQRCPIAHPGINDPVSGVLARTWPGHSELAVAVSVATGEQVVLADGQPVGRGRLTERAAGRDWRVTGAGFWQVHPGAAQVLVDGVRSALVPAPGEHLLDLYAGVGLFAGALAADLGADGRVDAVESDAVAVKDARRNLHDVPTVRLVQAQVLGWLRSADIAGADLVVLDPPRSGAGAAVVERLAALRPRAIAYVACDPASLARDVGMFAGRGYHLAGLRAFDLFPMTHHVECLALLQQG